MLVTLVAVPLVVCGAMPGLKLDVVKSTVDAWPVGKLKDETAASLARSATRPEAGFTVVADPEERADVLIRGLLAPTKAGPGVRFTWALKTEGCPMLTDQVAWDFKTPRLTPIALDTMSAQLAKRAQVLLEKARAQNATACIPSEGFGSRSATATRPATPKPPPQTTVQPAAFPTITGWGRSVFTSGGSAGPPAPPSGY